MPEKITLTVRVLLVLDCYFNPYISNVTNNVTFPGTGTSRYLSYSSSTISTSYSTISTSYSIISTSYSTNKIVTNSQKEKQDYQY